MKQSAEKSPARLAVAGAGLVGARHAELISGHAQLAGIADPAPSAQALAARLGVPWHVDLPNLLEAEQPDGVIVATPNQRHVEDGLACIAAGVPLLIEKPLASDVAGAERLVSEAKSAGVPLLTGHHRRYNPVIVAAKKAIDQGRLGRLVTVNALAWLCKPDAYFDVDWRRQKGAGPVFINLIHDVELLLHLCGDIVAVQAVESSAMRGNEVEDTAAALLHFKNGALGTVSVSDATTSPWSWELTAAENKAYPETGSYAYTIAGTLGALSVPDLGLWTNPEERGWNEPIRREVLPVEAGDPLAFQIRQFAEVALGLSAPKVTGADGLRALRVITGIKSAARTGGIHRVA